MKKLNGIIVLLLLIVVGYSCSTKEDDSPAVDETATTDETQEDVTDDNIIIEDDSSALKIQFEHFFKDDSFELEKEYTLENGQKIKTNDIKYYISNIVVLGDGIDDYTEENSYHLIDIKGKTKVTFPYIPIGKYKGVKFFLGVDSVKNHTIDNSGDLDPDGGMAWTWITGYRFFVIEGTFSSTIKTDDALIYHIGEDKNLNKFEFNFTDEGFTSVELKEGVQKIVKMKLDINEVFQNPNTLNLDEISKSTGGPDAEPIGENLSTIFSILGIE